SISVPRETPVRTARTAFLRITADRRMKRAPASVHPALASLLPQPGRSRNHHPIRAISFPFSSCRTCSGIHVSAGCAGVVLAAPWTPEQVRGDAKKYWNEHHIRVTGGSGVQVGSTLFK